MKPLIEEGQCSACQAPAERGRSGAWWHSRDPCGRRDARFQPSGEPPVQRQQQPPRNREIPHAPEDR